MTKHSASATSWPAAASTPARRRPHGTAPEAESLAIAIQKPADVLAAAAADAANGMLGGAKLGLLVAAASLYDALQAVDAEFARRYSGEASPLPGMPMQDGRS